jgi:tetratricopeptide (TPR) repeat protein
VVIDREKVLLAAQGYLQKKRYDKAVAEYQKIIQHDPDDARTLLKIGDLQSKMEQHAEAIATYERVGRYYETQGFALKAIAVYKQIREIVQKHIPTQVDRYSHITPRLADLYAQLGLVSDALTTYDEVALQLQRSGQDAKAVEVFKKIVDLDRTDPLPHLRLAEAYSRIRRVDEAILHFGVASEILVKLRRLDDALKVMERLLHHRADPQFARRAAEIYLERAQSNDGLMALSKLQICFQDDPKDLDTLSLLANAFIFIGQPAKSIEVQKELARIAKEKNNLEVYRDTVDNLLRLAPKDEQVQRLAVTSSEWAAAAREAPSEDEIEELDEGDIESEGHIAASKARSYPAGRVSAPEVEVSESAIDASELESDMDADDAMHPNRILSDTESLLKLGMTHKAVERLEQGLTAHPRSVPLRRRLRDIFYEAGDGVATAAQMIKIGGILIEEGQTQEAAEELHAILGFAPDHPTAREMLVQLGYELPTSQFPAVPEADAPAELEDARAVQPEHDEAAPPPVRQQQPSLPSYSMNEQPTATGALPSFPMDEEGETGAIATAASEYVEEPPAPASTEQLVGESAAAEEPALRPRVSGGAESVEEALDECDFFISRGLFDDARAILDEQLRRAPNHPIVLEHFRELDAAVAEQGSSGTRERPQHAPLGDDAEVDRAFDIAASLGELDGSAGELQKPDDQIDVEEVFAKFKAGVKAQISEADSATHYDLGLAYREMDLLPDAIDEFRLAARDPRRECVCQSMIGMICRAQGDVNEAVEAFVKGLHAEHKTPEQELSLYYELGDAYESKGNGSEALYYFRKVGHRAPKFNDPRGSIDVRIRTVQALGHRPSRERAVGAPDEFDAAFDAALGSGKQI